LWALGKVLRLPAGTNAVGIWLQNGSDFEIVNAVNGVAAPRNRVKDNLPLQTPTFVVGKFTWGANGAANDLFEIFLPGTNLVLPAAADSSTFVIDQSTFDELGIWMRFSRAQVDEIRFGASYEDVITNVSTAVPEPASIILAGLSSLLLLRRRRA
jgi:hypothetical protein